MQQIETAAKANQTPSVSFTRRRQLGHQIQISPIQSSAEIRDPSRPLSPLRRSDENARQPQQRTVEETKRGGLRPRVCVSGVRAAACSQICCCQWLGKWAWRFSRVAGNRTRKEGAPRVGGSHAGAGLEVEPGAAARRHGSRRRTRLASRPGSGGCVSRLRWCTTGCQIGEQGLERPVGRTSLTHQTFSFSQVESVWGRRVIG
jgi:hypothetical protein